MVEYDFTHQCPSNEKVIIPSLNDITYVLSLPGRKHVV